MSEHRWNHELAKERLKALGIRRDFAAQKLGLAYGSICRILSGSKPSGQTLLLLAQLLDVSVEELSKVTRRRDRSTD